MFPFKLFLLCIIIHFLLAYTCCEAQTNVGKTTVTDVLEENGMTAFLFLLKQTGWFEYLKRQENEVTVFAPTNAAFKRLSKEGRKLLFNKHSRLFYVISDHMILYKNIPTDVLSDGQELTVGLRETKVFINVRPLFDGTLSYYVNGKKITSSIATTNGIVHVTDGLLLDPSLHLIDFFQYNYHKFGIFVRLLHRANISYPPQFTVFAPINSAFRKIDKSPLWKMYKNYLASVSFVQNHIIPEKIFLSTLPAGPTTYYTLEGTHLVITRHNQNDFTVSIPGQGGNSVVTTPDLRVKRGLINTLDTVLVNVERNEVPLFDQLTLYEGYNVFMNGLRMVELDKLLNDGKKTYTILVASDRAFRSLPTALWREFQRNKTVALEILQNHVVPKRVQLDQLEDFQSIESISGFKLMIRKFGTGSDRKIMVDDAMVEERDVKSSNGLIHFVDSVFIRNNHTAWDIIVNKDNAYERSYNLSIAKDALKKTDLWKTTKSHTKHRYIFFIPTNAAFLKLPKNQLNYIQNNPAVLTGILENHIVPGYFHSNMKTSQWIYVYRSLYKNQEIQTRKYNESHLIVFNDNGYKASCIDIDIHASNGLLHIIDGLIVPKDIMLPEVKSLSISRQKTQIN